MLSAATKRVPSGMWLGISQAEEAVYTDDAEKYLPPLLRTMSLLVLQKRCVYTRYGTTCIETNLSWVFVYAALRLAERLVVETCALLQTSSPEEWALEWYE